MFTFKKWIRKCFCFLPLFAQAAETPFASYSVSLSSGRVAVWDSKPGARSAVPTVLFLHGHLCHKGFFSSQIRSPLLAQYRLICLDLPGCGESEAPKDPEKTYSFPGFADAVAELVSVLQLENIALVGWSLGGHVALELTSRIPFLKGLCITGAPPLEISAEGLARGFRIVNPEVAKCFGKGHLSRKEAELMGTVCGYDGSADKEFIVDAILQADEGAKTIYPASILQGVGQNELEIVRNWPLPIAVIAGEKDTGINNDYILHEVEFRNLWRGKVHMLKEAGHAVTLDQPNAFNAILREFLADIF